MRRLGTVNSIDLRPRHAAEGAVGPNTVLDQTGLESRWNFGVKWSLGIFGPMMNARERITVFDAVEKQLGLKLEKLEMQKRPMPITVIDHLEQRPSDN